MIIRIKSALRRTRYASVAALFLLSVVAVAVPATQKADAAALLYRSLQLSSTVGSDIDPIGSGGEAAPAGAPANGQKVSHTYIFQARSVTPIMGLSFQYCDDPFGYLGTCDAPGDFSADDAPSALVYKSTGGSWGTAPNTGPENITWAGSPEDTFTVSSHTDQLIQLAASATGVTPGTSFATGQYIKVVFTADATNFFVNPESTYLNGLSVGQQSGSFFAHITTYDDDTSFNSGAMIDEGTVTNSVANIVSINTRVQETLKFSVGSDVDPLAPDAGAPGATCDAVVGTGALVMGDSNQALSAQTAYTARSYFRLATNSSKGAQVLYSGQTLKSTAGDTITAINAGNGTKTASATGGEQFGLTLIADDAGDNFTMSQLTRRTNYDSSSVVGYAFASTSDVTPVPIASSTGAVQCDTGAVEYVANISNDTEAGVYSTKVAYIAVPSY